MGEVVWRAENLHAREWDGECVIYNGNNDRTHLVTGFAVQALSRLDRRPCDRSAIIDALMAVGAARGDAEESLAYLQELELIEIRPAE